MALLLAVSGCGNQTARAPSAGSFAWPQSIAYRVDYVSEAQKDLRSLARYSSTKIIRLTQREAQYVGDYDSVMKSAQLAGHPPVDGNYLPEDTLSFYVKLGHFGEISGVALGCDPAVAACQEANPSTVLLELRSIIPRLSQWLAPKGSSWVDTTAFDDAARERGMRGTVITTYTGHGDTLIGGRAYWLVSWNSVVQAFHRGAGGTSNLGAESPIEQNGLTLIDKQALLPVMSAWAGATSAPPEIRSMGATAAGFRGRAYIVGSAFDSTYNPRQRQ